MFIKSLILTLSLIWISAINSPLSIADSKAPKVEWSTNTNLIGFCVGENDAGDLAMMNLDGNTVITKTLNSSHEETGKYKAKVPAYDGLPAIITANGLTYYLTDSKIGAKRGIYAYHLNLNDGTLSEPIMLLDLSGSSAASIMMHTLSPNNKYALVAVEQKAEKKTKKLKYAVLNLKEEKLEYSDELVLDSKKLDIEIDKLYLSNQLKTYLIVSSARQTAFNRAVYEPLAFQLFVADRNTKAERFDFASEFKQNVSDVAVKTEKDGFKIFGYVYIPDVDLYSRTFILSVNKEGESELIKAPDEKAKPVKKSKLLSYEDQQKTNNADYDEFVGRDILFNADGSMYVVFEGIVVVETTGNGNTSFGYKTGNIKVLKLNTDKSLQWEKTVFKNSGALDKKNICYMKGSNYLSIVSSYITVQQGSSLKFIFREVSGAVKNQATSIDPRADETISCVSIDEAGTIKKNSCGNPPEIKYGRVMEPSHYKPGMLCFHIIGLKKGTFGLMDLGFSSN